MAKEFRDSTPKVHISFPIAFSYFYPGIIFQTELPMHRSFRTLFFLTILLSFGLFGCLERGPNIDDPASVADYLCAEGQELMEMATASEEPDIEAIDAKAEEISLFEAEVRAHHGEGHREFNAKVERHLQENCGIKSPQK